MNKTLKAIKFTGIEAALDLGRISIFFLYLTTFLIFMLVVIPAILKPAFLKGFTKNYPDFFSLLSGADPESNAGIGSICWLLAARLIILSIMVDSVQKQGLLVAWN